MDNFFELEIQGFSFTNGFKGGDVQRFEILTNLSVNMFDLSFYQDQNKCNYN